MSAFLAWIAFCRAFCLTLAPPPFGSILPDGDVGVAPADEDAEDADDEDVTVCDWPGSLGSRVDDDDDDDDEDDAEE